MKVVISVITIPKTVAVVLFVAACASWVNADDKGEQAGTRVQLSEDEHRAITQLLKGRPEKPAPLFLFTDPNKDPDDLSVLVIAKYLEEQGFIDLRCVLTTLGDQTTRTKRARFVSTVLDRLGMEGIAVGVGDDYSYNVYGPTGTIDVKATTGRRKDHQEFIETPFLDPTAEIDADGRDVFVRELSDVPDHSAIWLINCGMADPAALLGDYPDLAKQKIAKVVIMGGIEKQLNASGFVAADHRAYNNTTHQASADATYDRVQKLGLPLVVINKEAAYTAAAPRSFYEGMAATGHPVGVYLRNQQRQSLENLWEGINEGKLPPALTPAWFFKTFTDIVPESDLGKSAIARATAAPQDFDHIWEQVTRFNLYDPLALLAATPGSSDFLFQAEERAVARGTVRIIGGSSISDPKLAKDMLAGLAIESLNPPIRMKSGSQSAPGHRD